MWKQTRAQSPEEKLNFRELNVHMIYFFIFLHYMETPHVSCFILFLLSCIHFLDTL